MAPGRAAALEFERRTKWIISGMAAFSPRLETLPPGQRKLWADLAAVPKEFALYDGTALALHLGHRTSEDFDFFGNRNLDLTALEKELPFLAGAKIVRRAENTLSAIVDRAGDPVSVSFFGVPELPRLAAPRIATDNGLQIASLIDLAGTKASVVQMRAEARDYIDIDALIRLPGMNLSAALAAGRKIYGSSFNPEITLKALSYFDDGNLRTLPMQMKERLSTAAREIDLEHLPSIDHLLSNKAADYGIEP
jgi:hypothetical protein